MFPLTREVPCGKIGKKDKVVWIMHDRRALRRSQHAYIWEACLEYLISILVSGTFLAQITMELGFTDGQIGVISSIISLGCLFQLASMFLHRRTVKKFVVGMSIANQLLFMLLYAVPMVPLSQTAKQIIFVVFILLAYGVYYFAHPKKINWLMSLVEDGNRGRFTATKEMVSLAVGIGFSYAMGLVVDYYREAGNVTAAFTVSAVVMVVLMVLHTVTMAISVEIPMEIREEKSSVRNFFRNFLNVARQKDVVRVAIVFALWYLGSHCTTALYGTFQLKELGLAQSVTTLLVAAGSLTRILVSRPLGALADRFSFTTMIRLCLILAVAAFGSVALATPATGVICFLIYNIFYGAAMGGINSALTNLVFDYAPITQRADALAFCQSLAGICGFLAGVASSQFVGYMQERNNQLFGRTMYAQQITSLVAVAFLVVTIVYISVAFRTRKKVATDA